MLCLAPTGDDDGNDAGEGGTAAALLEETAPACLLLTPPLPLPLPCPSCVTVSSRCDASSVATRSSCGDWSNLSPASLSPAGMKSSGVSGHVSGGIHGRHHQQ